MPLGVRGIDSSTTVLNLLRPALDGDEGLLCSKRGGGRPFPFPSDDGGGLQVSRGCPAEMKDCGEGPESSVSAGLDKELS